MTAESLPRKISTKWNSAPGENFGAQPEEIAINNETNFADANLRSAKAENKRSQPDSGIKTDCEAYLLKNRVLKILMVEDSRDDCDLICFQLTKCGFAICVERVFCEEAMRAALERSRWDIMFTDHGLPGLTGTEVIALLQKLKSEIPAICITGSDDPVIIRKILAAGARACISKNDLSLLCMTVERALNENSNRISNTENHDQGI